MNYSEIRREELVHLNQIAAEARQGQEKLVNVAFTPQALLDYTNALLAPGDPGHQFVQAALRLKHFATDAREYIKAHAEDQPTVLKHLRESLTAFGKVASDYLGNRAAPAEDPECVCAETSRRNCPVHQNIWDREGGGCDHHPSLPEGFMAGCMRCLTILQTPQPEGQRPKPLIRHEAKGLPPTEYDGPKVSWDWLDRVVALLNDAKMDVAGAGSSVELVGIIVDAKLQQRLRIMAAARNILDEFTVPVRGKE